MRSLWKLGLLCAAILLLAAACGDSESDPHTPGETGTAPSASERSTPGQCSATTRSCLPPEACTATTCLPGSCLSDADCFGGGSAGPTTPGGGGGGTGLELRANDPITITHESAGDAVLITLHLAQRRMNELRDLVEESNPFDLARDAVGAPAGDADCAASGTVRIEAVSKTLADPISGDDRLFEGEAFTFDDCVLMEAPAPVIPGSDTLNGRALWLVAADDDSIRYTASETGLRMQLESDAQVAMGTQQAGTWEIFSGTRFASQGEPVDFGVFESERQGYIATEEHAYILELLPLDGPYARFERHTDDGTGALSLVSARVAIDMQDTEREDCVGPGSFDIRGERGVITEEGPAAGIEGMTYEIIGADGAIAVVRPNFEILGDPEGQQGAREDGFVVQVDGVDEVFDSSTATQRRDLLRDTCLADWPDFSP